MTILGDQKKRQRILIILALVLAVVGVSFRVYHIYKSDFIFYDEGYYLNHNRKFAQIITDHYPNNFPDLVKAFYTYIRFSLATGKALWFATVDFRIFLGGMKAWSFSRIVAALMGILTLGLIYRFARRFYDSAAVGWLAVAILAVLPSHVFYSRVGLQETFSTFFVLAGFYFYLFPRRFGWRTFLSGVLLAAAFFANYRMIILPGLVAICELWTSLGAGTRPSFRKYLWFVLTFLGCVFLIGNIDNGQNTTITFAWMFYQAQLAEKSSDLINLLSYPYYILRLDSILLGLFFFGNVYLLIKKKWVPLFPFILVCVQMAVFSFAYEKGARYLCVMIPFIVMSVAYLIVYLWERRPSRALRYALIVSVSVMLIFMARKSFLLSRSGSDYRAAAEYLLARDPDVKFSSTQVYVQNLYVDDKHRVKSCPHIIEYLWEYYSKGYRYLVVGPQAYISWTEDEKRFSPELKGYLGFITSRFPPIKVFPHFNDVVLERFVFDHNENLRTSIRFLDISHQRQFGVLKIYDLESVMPVLLNILLKQGYDIYGTNLPSSDSAELENVNL